jgi:hypothetical protein
MVQICSNCNQKNAHLAEGGTITSIEQGRYTPINQKSIASTNPSDPSSIVRFKVCVTILMGLFHIMEIV